MVWCWWLQTTTRDTWLKLFERPKKNHAYKLKSYYVGESIYILTAPRTCQIDMAPNDLQPHYSNGGFSKVYILALDNAKRQTLPAPHCHNGSHRSLGCPESRQCPVFNEEALTNMMVRWGTLRSLKQNWLSNLYLYKKKSYYWEKNPLAKTAVCICMNINDSYRYT